MSGLLQAAGARGEPGRGPFRRGRGFAPAQVSLTLLPLAGAPVFCMIVTDLTERRRQEQERAELERERSARAAAEEANRLKDEFLATLSHELRSPLNAIVAWAHILCTPGLDARHRPPCRPGHRPQRPAQTQLIADILDVSRIVTGKFRPEPVPGAICAT